MRRGWLMVRRTRLPHQLEHLARQLRDLGAHRSLQHRDVGGEAAHQLAGAAVGEEPGRELQQLGKELAPKPRDRPLAGRGQEIGLSVVEAGLENEEQEEPEGDAVEEGAVVGLEGGIEERAAELGKGQGDGPAAEERHQRQGERSPEGADPGPEADQLAGGDEPSPRLDAGRRAGHYRSPVTRSSGILSSGVPRMRTSGGGVRVRRPNGIARSTPIAMKRRKR